MPTGYGAGYGCFPRADAGGIWAAYRACSRAGEAERTTEFLPAAGNLIRTLVVLRHDSQAQTISRRTRAIRALLEAAKKGEASDKQDALDMALKSVEPRKNDE